MARDAASKPYKAPDAKLPDNLKIWITTVTAPSAFCRITLCGETRSCRSRRNSSIAASSTPTGWTSMRSPTARRRKSPISPRAFRSAIRHRPKPAPISVFAGFRLHATLNKPDYYDEVCVFLGASYFRAVAKGELYGLSARGLSINTGEAKGEEFPNFRTFWIEKPSPKTPIRSWCMPCSTARALRRPTNSRSGPAKPRCLTSKWRSIRASISIMPAWRR